VDDKKIHFVVPVRGESGLYLQRCILSILEGQDYPHKKVTVVYDGMEEKKQMGSALIARENFKDDERINFIELENNVGASAARNTGLDYVKEQNESDYIVFYDCDCVLQPGAIRDWLIGFEENPDCDFVYGGYRYSMRESYGSVIPSMPFDTYLLTCNNYISTMNPIKLGKCPRWNETLKGLQDWAFWLNVVIQLQLKGVMVPEWCTVTEPSERESNISVYTAKNWIECRKHALKSVGLGTRDIVVTTTGAPSQSLKRAQFLDADFLDPQILMKPHNYKAIISMGYFIESPMGAYSVFMNAGDAKKIIHFIGTDVWQLLGCSVREGIYLRKKLPHRVDKIYANAPWLVKELDEMGLESELLYCPIDSSKYSIKRLPKEFTVAVYCPKGHAIHSPMNSFYFDIARACPDIQWRFFGGIKPRRQGNVPKNIWFMGDIKSEDMPEFISRTSCILRITKHDGFPASVAEWVLSGRAFIFNNDEMPYNNFPVSVELEEGSMIKDKENVITAIRECQRGIRKISDRDLKEARDHYSDLLDPEKYRLEILRAINEVEDSKPENIEVLADVG